MQVSHFSEGDSMTPICVCSVGNDKGLELFLASVRLYVPEPIVYLASPQPISHFTPFKWIKNEAGNFGDAYNKIMAEAFMDGHETVILANDDVVLDPSTYWLLAHDRVILRQGGHKVGFVAARSNMTSLHQNIRNRAENDTWQGMKWASEDSIAQTEWVAPLFASVDREGWPGFPPTNFFSDNVACWDMANDGFKHFLSRAYVHHVGSATIGKDAASGAKNTMEAEDWLKLNRPLLHKRYFGSNL